jgi:hypothetical protein
LPTEVLIDDDTANLVGDLFFGDALANNDDVDSTRAHPMQVEILSRLQQLDQRIASVIPSSY